MSLRAALTQHEVELLARWLPTRTGPGREPTEARALVSEMFFEPLRGEALIARRNELDRAGLDLRHGASWEEYNAPIGRGGVSRGLHGATFPHRSAWESSYVISKRWIRPRESASIPAGLEAFAAETRAEPLSALLVALLCQDTLEDARAVLRGAARLDALAEDPWVLWLRDERAAPGVIDHRFEEPEAVTHALELRFNQAYEALSDRGKKLRPRAVTPTAERTMVAQVTAQWITHAIKGRPTLAALERSVGTLFSYWSHAPGRDPYEGTNVLLRLPVVALRRAQFSPAAPALDALYTTRAHIDHVTTPIVLTFTAPAEVLAPLDALRAVVQGAVERGLTLHRRWEGSLQVFSAE